MRVLLHFVVTAPLCFSVLCIDHARGASFRGLGDLEGGETFSIAAAISRDGQVVVGAANSDVAQEPFIWTPQGGMKRLDNILTVITPGTAADVSADGSVVVGRAFFSSSSSFRWQDAGFHLFGQSPSVANGVSADGAIVVGTDDYSPGGGPAPVTGTAYRWSEDKGTIPLADLPGGPDCSRANDVSANGRVVVGTGDCDASFQVEDLGTAVRWVDGGEPESLGTLTGGFFDASHANAVSPEGNAIVGDSRSENGVEPFIWTEAKRMVGLGNLPGENYGFAEAASSNGRFVVGASGERAFVWTEHLGMIDVQEMLETARYKLNLKGWTLTSATAISPDGFFLAGEGINPDGEAEAWWADLYHIPPGSDGDGDIDLDDLNDVRNNFGGSGIGDMPPYDGIVDLNDLNFVRNAFGAPPRSPAGVPEPSTLLLAFASAIVVGMHRITR